MAYRKRTTYLQKTKMLAKRMKSAYRDPKKSQFSRYQLAEIRKARSVNSVNTMARSFKTKQHPKRYVYDSNPGTVSAGGFLYNVEFTRFLDQGSAINQRERQLVLFKGVQLSIYLKSLDPTKNANFRWAVIAPKGSFPQSTYTAELNLDFYRGTGTNRYVDFDQVASGLHHLSYPINRDKYTIFAQGKKTLAPLSLSNNQGTTSSFFQLDEYIPLGYKVEYDGTSVNSSKNPIFFVYWFQQPDRNAIAPVANEYEITFSLLPNFLEPQ